MKVQQELMRHASIQTTMNVYGQALSSTKRQANSKVVQMVLKPTVSVQTNEKGADVRLPNQLRFSYWGFLGVSRFNPNSRKLMIPLVAGGGFEPPTFGLCGGWI